MLLVCLPLVIYNTIVVQLAGISLAQYSALELADTSILLALSAYFLMHDYSDTAKFLNDDERKEVQRRLEADRSFLDDKFNLKYFWDAVRDWKIWVYMIITIGIYSPLYSFSLFLPTIIKELGTCLECASYGHHIADNHARIH